MAEMIPGLLRTLPKERTKPLYGVVYVITNDVNDKLYVGITTQPIRDRFRQHGRASNAFHTPISRAINKHGRHHFKIRILEPGYDAEELGAKEVAWCERLGSMSPNGYNLQVGDSGSRKHSPETIEKIKKARAQQVFSAETRAKWSKNRSGAGSSTAKLTEDQVRAIRSEYRPRLFTYKMLGEKYDLNPEYVGFIVRRETWKDLDD